MSTCGKLLAVSSNVTCMLNCHVDEDPSVVGPGMCVVWQLEGVHVAGAGEVEYRNMCMCINSVC